MELPRQTYWEQIRIPLLAGAASNMAGTLAGHPLDTIRVRMQLESRRITTRQCAYEALVNEGALSLYKGVSQPLLGATPINSIVFIVEEASKEKLRQQYPKMSTTSQAMWAGAIGGVASLSIFVPMDLLKIRAQLTKEGKLDYLKESRAILKEQGVRGLYRGFWASAARDTPGWAVYFSSYEWLKVQGEKLDTICPVSEDKRQWRDFLWRLNAGGSAGVLSWIASLPQDALKTKQQAHIGKEPLRLREACREIKNEGGIRRLFKGVAPTLARGYIVNFVTLPMFDVLTEKMRSEQFDNNKKK